jgi:hypothetical protein
MISNNKNLLKNKANSFISILILFFLSFSIIKSEIISSSFIGNTKTNLTIKLLDPGVIIPAGSIIIITVPK